MSLQIRQRVFDIFRLTYFFKIWYVRTRSELPVILNRQRLLNKGVEIGVWKGEFSELLLSKWKGKRLYSVDPWKQFSDEEYIDDMNISQKEFDDIYESVCKRLSPYGSRASIIRKTSEEAAKDFTDGELDFVYLDGLHNYEGVKEDIKYWYPKIKKGGMLCGHDYINGTIGKTAFGVKQAVDELAAEKKLKLLITHKDNYPSWFVFIK